MILATLLAVSLGATGDADSPGDPTRPADARSLLARDSIDGWRAAASSNVLGSVTDGVLRLDAGADLRTDEPLGDYHLHLRFRFDKDADPEARAGILAAERYEVVLGPGDVGATEVDATSPGAIHGVAAPTQAVGLGPGAWQTLDLAYSHKVGEAPRMSVWWNDVRIQRAVIVESPTPNGITTLLPGDARGGALFVADDERSRSIDLSRPFTVSARFRTRDGGTLVAKCQPEGDWSPDGRAFFLRGGRLVYDIGWVGAVTSGRTWNDDQWHHAVFTSEESGSVRLFVDGELEAERDDFRADDRADFVLKIGAASHNFGGTYSGAIEEVRLFDVALDADTAKALSEGHSPDATPTFLWPEGDDAVRPGDPQRSPIRLRAEAPLEVADLWLVPLGEVDHDGLIDSLDDDAFQRGRTLYQGLCVSCHGADGGRPPNPRARAFTSAPLLNGHDPKSIYDTITSGFREMPGNPWLRPDQRYDLVHYLREAFLREQNPSQYFEVTAEWRNTLPKGHSPPRAGLDDAFPRRDFGPVLASQLGDDVGCALTVRLDGTTSMAYDLQVMSAVSAWTGGFLDLKGTQHYRQRGEGRARPDGATLRGLEGFGFGHDGTLDWDRSRRAPRAPLPEDWLRYHGHHVFGDDVVLAYAIDGREVLEQPGLDRSAGIPVITHRLRIDATGPQLALQTIQTPEGPGEATWSRAWTQTLRDGTPMRVLVQGRRSSWDFAAAAAVGLGDFTVDADGRAVLHVPADDAPVEGWVLRSAGRSRDELRAFRTFIDSFAEREMPPSPRSLLGGGPARYDEALRTQGVLGDRDGAYALDTLTLPDANPWNAWLRTSALDFFDDGRAAVSTYGGDVWIVSGIDDSLRDLRWRRFASGMFEPMGVRVIDDLVYVTCRDRIVRLHDENGDGEADRYESFFADPDVSPNFHAFNFDLQTDPTGFLYYAKSGQYTDFALPGAILRVTPDGASYDVYCTGLRTPNGMGMSPTGRPLVSDNQGNWVPASKVTLARAGGFYGVFQSLNTSSPGIATRDDFDPPVIWMPQRLDSSSGGQLFVDDPRFGPLHGRYLHTSFGKGWMYALVIDGEDDDLPQGAVWRLPFQFAAGIQRLRVNPKDGQVYAVGLSGWQGPAEGEDGCLQRLRYTGQPQTLLVDARARGGALVLTFDGPLAAAPSPDALSIRRWNYQWARSYGSDHHSIDRQGEVGEDPVAIREVRLADAGRRLEIELEDPRPAHQVELEGEVTAADGAVVPLEVYFTVHRIE